MTPICHTFHYRQKGQKEEEIWFKLPLEMPHLNYHGTYDKMKLKAFVRL